MNTYEHMSRENLNALIELLEEFSWEIEDEREAVLAIRDLVEEVRDNG